MKMRRWLGDGAAVALGLVLALALAEIVLRVVVPETAFLNPRQDAYWLHRLRERPSVEPADADMVGDPRLGWRMRPSYHAPGVSHNLAGFRGVHEPSLQPTRPRVLTIGDSFTYGLGVGDEETFGALLAHAMGAEVINAGVNGYGIDQALLMWEEKGRQLGPQVVVLGYYVDDFFRNGLLVRDWPKPQFAVEVNTAGYELLMPAQSLERAQHAATASAGHWRLGKALALAWHKAQNRLGLLDEDNLRPLAHTSHFLLTRLNESVKASGARLVVAFIGHVHQEAPEFRWIEATVMQSCRDLQIECVDLAAATSDPAWPRYYGANAHWSPFGHRFAATEIGRVLQRNAGGGGVSHGDAAGKTVSR